MMRALFLLLSMAGALACGVSTQPLESFDVSLVPTQDCTLTGATSRNCKDGAALAAQKITGRWIFEQGPSESFTLTTEDGDALPGIYFNDDATVLNQDPCVGGNNGALCYFARKKTQSTDAKNNNCQHFTELVAILLRTDQNTLHGVLSDTAGSDENCGTSTVQQVISNVNASKDTEAALARVEADSSSSGHAGGT